MARLARSPELAAQVEQAWQTTTAVGAMLGSTGSRLLTGNSRLAEDLEASIARFHDAPTALLFNSGYDANLGFFACVPQAHDVVLFDELIHASVHDGMRLGRAPRKMFRHNDLSHLAQLLLDFAQESNPESSGAISSDSGTSPNRTRIAFVVVETIYSMDGDEAPLEALVDLCDRHGACVVVDEAHATGVFGPHGAGCVQQHGLQDRVFARLHTFGKGLGCHGAAILGSAALQVYLINYARSVIYTTSLPAHSLVSIRIAYDVMARADERRAHLRGLVRRFQSRLGSSTSRLPPPASILPSSSAIQGVVVPGNDAVVQLAAALRAANFDVKPIRSPTVPAGTERVRICLHAHNTIEQVDRLCDHILAYFDHHHRSQVVPAHRL